ncbi:MAG: sulfatase-like hydrolase/transferase [Phycisphaerae bacterium]
MATRNCTRRGFLKALGLGAAAMAAPRVMIGRDKAGARRPNVLLILTDDQGTLDANCYGSKDLYTPAMDAIARGGVRFTQAYAHTVCCPARAMLLTGRHPQRCNVNSWMQGNAKGKKGLNMFREEVTISEVLKAAGYRTALFGKWHLGAHFDHGPTEQGFDEFLGIRDGFIDNYNHYFLHGNGYHDLYRGRKEVFRKGEYFPDMITAEATGFIERNRDRPFFLYLAFNIPHYPEQADRKFDERYKHLPMPRRSYAGIISTTDDRIGRVLAKLDELNIRDGTIIALMSDNGHSAEDYRIKGKDHASGLPEGANYGANGGGGNTGKWRGHKGTFYEGGIRVPAMISFPKRLPQNVVRDQAVTAADFLPTICELCGVEPPKRKLDGKSLLPIIRDNAPTHHKVMHWQWQSRWAVREGDWKLLGRGSKPQELLTLAGDQPERENLLKKHPEIVERLARLHAEWLKEVTP